MYTLRIRYLVPTNAVGDPPSHVIQETTETWATFGADDRSRDVVAYGLLVGSTRYRVDHVGIESNDRNE